MVFPMTLRRYYTDPARMVRATVLHTAADDRGSYAVLDATLFHPQGGGQPSDTGTIAGIPVAHVAVGEDGVVRHYVETCEGLLVGEPAVLEIDQDVRTLHERLHTAGHLIASLTELLFPQAEALSGHHWPGEARVDFQLGENALDPDSIGLLLDLELRRVIARGPRVYATQVENAPRMVVIDGYRPIACGGTHTPTVSEIGAIELRGVKIKKNRLRVGYDVVSPATSG